MVNIDKLDKKILNILLEDSRLSYREIARKLDVSTATVANRTRKLEKSGIIKGYSASIDYGKLEYNIEVIIDVITSEGKEDEIMKKIYNNKNIFAIYDMTGDYDITLIARFQNREELNRFLHELRSNEFVERTHTRLILKVSKEETVRI